MLTNQLHIFIEYPIKDAVIQQYEETMKNVVRIMEDLGANEIQWTKTTQKKGVTYYTESFFLPTESHYFAMKDFRCSSDNHVFHELSQFIDVETGNIQYIGLKITS